MADVFISFIHEEQEVATATQRLLKAEFDKKQIFVSSDQWQLHAGEDWLARIKQELSTAKVIVLLLSKTSVQRPWVNFEAGAAWLSKIPIIPACFGGLSKGNLPKPYSTFQGVNLPADAYQLITSVSHHLGEVIPPPPIWGRHDEEVRELEEAIQKIEARSNA